MPISIECIGKPDLYFQKYDFRTGSAIFREMTRDSYRESAFLDDRLLSPNPELYGFSIDQAMAIDLTSSLPPYRLIFHTAYCCSTLLSRALDISGRTMVYREPVHLHQLAVARRRFTEFPQLVTGRWPELLRFSLSMLSKVWSGNEVSIIKPTDSCNNIIIDILALDGGSRAVLLYSQAREFIASNLKSAGRRRFLKNFLGRSIRENALDSGSILHSVDASGLPDAESAAYVWMTQILSYRKALSERADQCACIDSARLLSNTRCALMDCNQFLEIGLSETDIDAVVDSGLWQRHAKDATRSYSSAERQHEMQFISKHLETEIQAGMAWLEQFDGWNAPVRFEGEIGTSGCS